MSSEINGLVTNYSNGRHVTICQEQFLRRAIEINKNQHRPFSYLDFPQMSAGHFRQMKHTFRDIIKIEVKSNPCFYRIKGIPVLSGRLSVTDNRTGANMFTILKNLREQPPKIHDIKLKFSSDLHHILIKKGEKPNPTNSGIFKPFRLDDFTLSRLSVYPETIQIDLGCSHRPLVYDILGVFQLVFYLGQLHEIMTRLGDFQSRLPFFGEWIVTHYHFGKDGSETYSGQSFHRTFEDLSAGLVRFYSKEMHDGKTISRFEQVQTPNQSLNKEIDKIIQQEYVR